MQGTIELPRRAALIRSYHDRTARKSGMDKAQLPSGSEQLARRSVAIKTARSFFTVQFGNLITGGIDAGGRLYVRIFQSPTVMESFSKSNAGSPWGKGPSSSGQSEKPVRESGGVGGRTWLKMGNRFVCVA